MRYRTVRPSGPHPFNTLCYSYASGSICPDGISLLEATEHGKYAAESKVIPMSQTAPLPQAIVLPGVGNKALPDTIAILNTTTFIATIERPPHAAPRMSIATTILSQPVKIPDYTTIPSLLNNHTPEHKHTTPTCVQSQSDAGT